jgi:hypothetical protein
VTPHHASSILCGHDDDCVENDARILSSNQDPPILLLILIVGVQGEKAYPIGCSGRDPSFYDYERYVFPPKPGQPGQPQPNGGFLPIRNQDDFWILRRLGTGKFSDFEALDDAAGSKSNNNNPRNVATTTQPAIIDPHRSFQTAQREPFLQSKIHHRFP